MIEHSVKVMDEANKMKEENGDNVAISELEDKSKLCKEQAIEVLSSNTKHLPYAKLTKNFGDEEVLSSNLINMYTKTIQQMET